MNPFSDNRKEEPKEQLSDGLKKLKEKGDGEKFSPGEDPNYNAEEFSTD